jgi:hypothetical protein
MQVIIAFTLTACGFNTQTRSFTNSSFLSENEQNIMMPYFSNIKQLVFNDSIRVNFDVTTSNIDYLPNDDYFIEISFVTPNNTIKNNLNYRGFIYYSPTDSTYMFIEDEILIDVYNNTAFIAWVSKTEPNFETGTESNYELFLKSIDLMSGKEYFNKKIYSKKFGIDRVSMIYNPFTSSVLFAYSDYSKSNSNHLMYGFVKINENNLPENEFNPIGINRQDEWDKNEPQFLIDKQFVYLYHSTGDNWGLFAHTGKTQIGISKINERNIPVDYRIIADSLEIATKLILHNDTLYYRVRCTKENNPDEMKIKKTTIYELEKF